MKRLLALLLCLLCAPVLAACGTGAQKSAETQLANPFADYDSLAEAEAAAGVSLAAPTSIDGCSGPDVQLMSGKMLQLIFRSDSGRIIIRKAAGSEDISGDYTSYAETKTARVNGCDVTLKGADGKVSTAVWCANGYSYALLSDVPMATDILTDLIVEIA